MVAQDSKTVIPTLLLQLNYDRIRLTDNQTSHLPTPDRYSLAMELWS
jgi:hypothetical protein